MSLLITSTSIAIIIISLLYWVVKRNQSYWIARNVPHDKPSFFFGNLQGVGTKRHLSEAFLDTYRRYKGREKFVGFYMLFSPAIYLIDLDLIKTVLVEDFCHFTDRGLYYNEKDDPLSAHLVYFDGSRWTTLRRKLTPTFTAGKMKFMFPTLVGVANQFVDVLRDIVATDDIVEIKHLLARYTVDVIGTCAFGIECNSLKDPNTNFAQMGRKSFLDRRHGILAELFMKSHPETARFFKMKDTLDEVSDFFTNLVRDTVEYREAESVHQNDFMNILIGLKNNAEPGQEAMTLNEIAAQAFVFFLGGFETSSTTMAYTLYQLAQHEAIQDRMREEILSSLRKFDNEFTYECMMNLKYMEQVICETLRHRPIIPHLLRKAITDYPIPGSSFTIEKETQIIIPIDAIHHDPDIYPNPDVFDPERFRPETVLRRNSVAYLPFGLGPRNCIGERFANMQMRVGLASLLRHFKFSCCHKTEIPLKMSPKGVIITSEGGIYLRAEIIS